MDSHQMDFPCQVLFRAFTHIIALSPFLKVVKCSLYTEERMKTQIYNLKSQKLNMYVTA